MATVTVDVEVDLDEFDEDEIVDELEHRGYYVSKGNQPEVENIDKYEVEYLLDLVDKAEKKYYNHYALREKLNKLF